MAKSGFLLDGKVFIIEIDDDGEIIREEEIPQDVALEMLAIAYVAMATAKKNEMDKEEELKKRKPHLN